MYLIHLPFADDIRQPEAGEGAGRQGGGRRVRWQYRGRTEEM